jgi:predicted nucleotidyltransferase
MIPANAGAGPFGENPSGMSNLDREFAEEYRRQAESLFPGAVEDVRVFGSRARGDNAPDSDLDLFVLMRDEDSSTRARLFDLAWDVAYRMELPYQAVPHVMTRGHFERLKSLECRLALDILQEGQPV